MDVTITKVQVDGKNNPIRFHFGKLCQEFNDMAHLRAWVKANLPTEENLRAMAIASVIKEQANLSNPELIVNRKLSLNEQVEAVSK